MAATIMGDDDLIQRLQDADGEADEVVIADQEM